MADTIGQKPGGRQKGTPNKLTRELHSTLSQLQIRQYRKCHQVWFLSFLKAAN